MIDEITSFNDFKWWCSGVHHYDFEKIVAEIYRDTGLNATVTQQSNDGGVDVILYDGETTFDPSTVDVEAIVQVKLENNIYGSIGPEVLQKLVDAAPEYNTNKLAIVTTGKFSSTLLEQVNEITAYDVELLQAEDLYNMVSDETLDRLHDQYESKPGRKL